MFDLTIKTERLLLRPFRLEDGPAVEKLAGDWNVARMTTRIPHPYPAGSGEAWIATHDAARQNNSVYPFAVTRAGELIGCVGLNNLDRKSWTQRVPDEQAALELGYWIGAPFWGQGFATEATAAVITFAFDRLRKTHLVAGCFRDNAASRRVLEKHGFASNGSRMLRSAAQGREVECILMAPLTRDAWAAKKV